MPKTLELPLMPTESKSHTNNTETISLLQIRALINQNLNLTRPEKNQILWSLQKLKTNDLPDSNEATLFKQAIANAHNFKDANRYLESLQLEYQKQLLTNQIDSIVTYKKLEKTTDNVGSLYQRVEQYNNQSQLPLKAEPTNLSISQKISNARKNILLKFGGIATAAVGIGMALNNTFKQPEIAYNPVLPEQPQVTQTFKPTRKPNSITETINKAPKVEITSNPVTSPSLMKFNFSAQKIEGTISNTTEFNLNSLIKLIKNGGFDSGNILGKLINDKDGSIDPRRVQNLTDSGILKLSTEKGQNNNEQVRFIIDLQGTSFKFSRIQTPEIQMANELNIQQKDNKVNI